LLHGFCSGEPIDGWLGSAESFGAPRSFREHDDNPT
jgi:hypothetical protein